MKIGDELKGVGAIAFNSISFAFATVFSRWIGNEIPLFYQSSTRAFFCAILIFVWIVLIKRESIPYYKKDTVWLVLRSLGGVFGFLGFFIGVTNAAIGVTYFAYFAGTLLAGYAMGSLFFKEKITKVKLFSLLMALVGLILTYFEAGLYQIDWFVIFAVIGGISFSLWTLLVKKLKGGYSVLQVTAIDFTIAGILYGLASLFLNEPWIVPAINLPWIGSLYLAASWTLGGVLLVYGFKRVEATIGSLILLAEVPLAVLIGELIYKEHLSVLVWAGGVLILIASALPEVVKLLNNKYRYEKA